MAEICSSPFTVGGGLGGDGVALECVCVCWNSMLLCLSACSSKRE